MQDSKPIVTVKHSHYGETKTIDRKNPNQAHIALGWIMTTYCKSTAQFNILKDKARLFDGAILQSRMQKYDTTTA
jgi:hypothetical protein